MKSRDPEKKAENAFVKKVREHGALRRKMNGLGNRAWPDDLIIALNGAHCWLEFKRVGEDLTPLQAEIHRDFAKRGIKVHIVRTVDEGLRAYAEEKSKWQDYRDWLARSSNSARTRKKP